jgi:hypothetical protein
MANAGVDATTMATPLTPRPSTSILPSLWQLLLGNVGGCVGETSALAALIGGLYLVIRGVADWRQPLACLVVVFLFAWVSNIAAPASFEGPGFHLTSGALMFGAFFIATDYVGAPVNPTGRLIFGAGVGLAGDGDPPVRGLSRGVHVRDPDHERADADDRAPDHADAVRRARAGLSDGSLRKAALESRELT